MKKKGELKVDRSEKKNEQIILIYYMYMRWTPKKLIQKIRQGAKESVRANTDDNDSNNNNKTTNQKKKKKNTRQQQ